jgi:general secretion pathway protein D
VRPRRNCSTGGELRLAAAAALLLALPLALPAQTAGAPGPQSQAADTASAAQPKKLPTTSDRRRAAKLYISASRLYANSQFEQALDEYRQAAALDPTNANYSMAAEVARSHAAAALVQTAARQRLGGDEAAARATLLRAYALDPNNPEVTQHLYEFAAEQASQAARPLYQKKASQLGPPEPLLASTALHSFHLKDQPRQLIQQVFRAYGIEPLMGDSVDSVHGVIRFEIDNASFAVAARALGLVTDTFYVPMDAHRVLVARDTPDNRKQFMREQVETVYLAGLADTELSDVENLAKNVFGVTQSARDPSTNALTLRAPEDDLDAFNANMRSLLAGRNQVMLDMRVIQLAHNSTRNTGAQLPQSISAFNVYAEEQAILNANQALVQQIISSGLAAPGDTLAILGILLASGQVSSSLFQNGLALFGGGLTQSALSPGGPATLNLNLNTSDSRTLDDIRLRLGDGEAGTIKLGTKYPIQTSSYSSLSPTLPNIPGLTGAGASGSLGSLLASLSGAAQTIPMIQYQDLGLTLKVTPNVLRNGTVALTVDFSITALAGSSINGNPILNNEAASGIVTLKEGEAVEVASEIDQSESRAISGTPGLSEVPGLNNAIGNNTNQKNYSTLLIIITPHVVRATQEAGHTPPMLVETAPAAQ